jgi:hypothetical protein
MGGGSYSYDNSVRSRTDKGWASENLIRSNGGVVPAGYITATANAVFTETAINNAMSPKGVKVRESRDSEEHPESLAIVVALDETGSMGTVPHHLVKEGLPNLMDRILKAGVKDPQVLFLGVGDHECDDAPLQVSQFESSDELLDKWLTSVYLEGKGGGNEGESYALAWYFAGRHTAIDCLEKRGRKGILFTIGDEPVLQDYPARVLKGLMGEGQYGDETAQTLLAKAREKYECFHVHISETGAGSMRSTVDGWKQLMGPDYLLVAKSHTEVPELISAAILKTVGVAAPANVAPAATPATPDQML